MQHRRGDKRFARTCRQSNQRVVAQGRAHDRTLVAPVVVPLRVREDSHERMRQVTTRRHAFGAFVQPSLEVMDSAPPDHIPPADTLHLRRAGSGDGAGCCGTALRRWVLRGKNHPFQPMLEPHDAQQRYRSTLRHRRRSPRPRRLAPAAVATAVAALALAASAHALATAARAPPAPLPAHALATAARAPPAPLPMTAAGAHAHAPTHVPAPARNLLSARALLTRRGSPASATALKTFHAAVLKTGVCRVKTGRQTFKLVDPRSEPRSVGSPSTQRWNQGRTATGADRVQICPRYAIPPPRARPWPCW